MAKKRAKRTKRKPKPKQTAIKTVDLGPDVFQQCSCLVAGLNHAGTGVIIPKEGEKGIEIFVLTAAHVVEDLRVARKVYDEDGNEVTRVSFEEGSVHIKLYRGLRDSGGLWSSARVLRFSPPGVGDDLAVLHVLTPHETLLPEHGVPLFTPNPLAAGMPVYHAGCMGGSVGYCNMTHGVVSYVGRDFGGRAYDVLSAVVWPGCSGGGVWSVEDGEYIGMVVAKFAPGFTVMLPSRRIFKALDRMDIGWLLDPEGMIPEEEKVNEFGIEEISLVDPEVDDEAGGLGTRRLVMELDRVQTKESQGGPLGPRVVQGLSVTGDGVFRVDDEREESLGPGVHFAPT